MNTPELVNAIITSSTIAKMQAGITIRSIKSTLANTFTSIENTNLYNYNLEYVSTLARTSSIKYHYKTTHTQKHKYTSLKHLTINKLYYY